MPEEQQPSRPRAEEIYDAVRADAGDELERSSSALGFSGLFSGFTLSASALTYAAVLVMVDGGGAELVAALLYPVGYVAVILGRAQLFTENTLYPVLLVLDEPRRYLASTARLWAIVLATNVLGTLLFALIAVETSALPSDLGGELGTLGDEAVGRAVWTTFWAAVLTGWLLALVAWLVEATRTAVGVVLVVWALTMIVGLLQLDHSVATTVEAWAALLGGDVGLGPAAGWWATTVLGNVVGGVFIVAVVNYGQVRSD